MSPTTESPSQSLAPSPEGNLERSLERRSIERSLRLPARPRRPSRWERRRQRLRERWKSGELSRQGLLGAQLLAIAFAILAFGGVYGWAYGLAYLLIFAAVTGWCWQCWRGRLRAEWQPIYVPVLLYGGLTLAQYGMGLSAVPASTATAMLHLGAAGALFLLVSQCYRPAQDVGWITASFSIFTAALALLAILQILTASNGIYWHFTYAYASPAGSFVNRNHFAGCMEMLLPAACVGAYQHRHRAWLYFVPWAAAPALGVAAVVLAASRGGAAALAAQALAAAVLLLVLGRRRAQVAAPTGLETAGWLPLPLESGPPPGQPERREHAAQTLWHHRRAADPLPGSSGLGRWITLAVAVALTFGLVLAVGQQRLQTRLEATNLHAPSVEQRTNLNLSSLSMFRARPWLGWGLGTWADAYPPFARFTDTSIYSFAHNDYLQMLAETGLAGLGCMLLFWSLWGWNFTRRLRAEDGEASAPAGVAMAVAAGIACLGILVHSWVDYNLHIPANLLLFYAMAALSYPTGRLGAGR